MCLFLCLFLCFSDVPFSCDFFLGLSLVLRSHDQIPPLSLVNGCRATIELKLRAAAVQPLKFRATAIQPLKLRAEAVQPLKLRAAAVQPMNLNFPLPSDSMEIMSEEELHRPSDQTDFKVEVKRQMQVQVLVQLHCSGLSKTAHYYQFTATF